MYQKKQRIYQMRYLFVGIVCLVILLISGCGKKEIVSLEKVETKENREKPDVEKVPKTIMVYVCGEVKVPGVYELPENSRVYQAVEKAGGMNASAAVTYLNQAALVSDGEQVYVPNTEEVKGEGVLPQPNSNEAGGMDGKININTASAEELMTLAGIGEAKAKSIIAYREEHGMFQKIEDIMQITGIKEGMFSKIKDYITVAAN